MCTIRMRDLASGDRCELQHDETISSWTSLYLGSELAGRKFLDCGTADLQTDEEEGASK